MSESLASKPSALHAQTMINNSSIFLLLFCLAWSSTADVGRRPKQDIFPTNHDVIPSPSLSASSSRSTRILDSYSESPGPDGYCHLSVTTKPIMDSVVAQGIAFAIKSDDRNDDGLMITSFGFHIHPSAVVENGGKIEYQLYKHTADGHYTSERDSNNPQEINKTATNPFDHRGKLEDHWELIAGGHISEVNLTKSTVTLNIIEGTLFRIPFGQFEKILVPPNGGLRSFYFATKTPGLIYSIPPEGMALFDEMTLTPAGDTFAPKVLVGEGILAYPMPTDPSTQAFYYHPKSFVGTVYYEKECPSPAPSISAPPTDSPIVPSQIPSAQPSRQLSEQPSAVPSEMPSSMPSLEPTIFKEKIAGGLLTQITMDCKPGKGIPKGESDNVAKATQIIAAEEGKNATPPISNINAIVVATHCTPPQPRHLSMDVHTGGDINHRHLPTSSSAVDFSVVITGEYSPPRRIGASSQPPKPPDLGRIAEDSINRDPVRFVKTLKERAGTASVFSAVEDDAVKVQSFEVDDDFDVEDPAPIPRVTLEPTPGPTLSPTIMKEDNVNSILFICIIITSGIIVLLSAFLLFRHGERRAAKQRREKMARLEEKKAKDRLDKQRRADAERVNTMHRHDEMESKQRSAHPTDLTMRGPGAQYGYPPGYGYPPPPPPNYYAGDPHSQKFNYGYGGTPHPPPPYGQHYGGPNHQGPPYSTPPTQSANYGQPPQLSSNERTVRWE